LGKEVASAIATGAGSVHFDVIDPDYVPNSIVGPVDRTVAGFASAGGECRDS
jgi:pentose-5-phosphate-3-epimerase